MIDTADLCQQKIAEEKKAGRLTSCSQIGALIRPIILAREQDVVQAARAVWDKESKPKRTKQTFGIGIPPDPQDVTDYSASIDYPLDGPAWCDNYAAKGWVVSGRTKMQDWKAAVRNWKKSGWGQESGIALRKKAPPPTDPRYGPEPQGDWRKTARRILGIEELPEGWTSWATVPPEYRGKIVAIHLP